MPIYEYHCKDCRAQVSILVRMNTQSSPVCTNCGGTKLNRLLSNVAIVKSSVDRSRDLSWIDNDLKQRYKLK
jgi:putative FmdB family regulatory protein